MKFHPRRRIRPKLSPENHSYHHVVSRVVDRRHIFGPDEKTKFLSYVRRYEKFCKVRIIGYCLMDNHFHLLVRVPGRPEQRPTQQVLMEHVRSTLGETVAAVYQERIDYWEEQLRDVNATESAVPIDPILAQAELDKVSQDIWQRMYDISQYIFSVKQQFSHWYNKKAERVGTLWEERFRATLVQEGPALAEVAAYMDLNPVRAGLARDAKNYPWSQYGAAAGGDALALQGVHFLSEHQNWLKRSTPTRNQEAWVPSQTLRIGLLLMELLLERRGMKENSPNDSGQWDMSLDPLPGGDYTGGSIRSFTRGVALGDSAFLERVFMEHRDQFGRHRRSGARPIRLPELENIEPAPLEATSPPPLKPRRRITRLLKALRDVSPG